MHAEAPNPGWPAPDVAPERDAPGKGVTTILERHRVALDGGPRLFVRPAIPPEILDAARSKYAPDIDPGAVLLLLDTSMRANGKTGFLLTATEFVGHEPLSTASVPLSDLILVEALPNKVRVVRRAKKGPVGGVAMEFTTGALGNERSAALAGVLQEIIDTVAEPADGTPVDAPAKGDKIHVLLDSPRSQPGDALRFEVQLDPWPDSKIQGVDVDLAFEHTTLHIEWVDPSKNAQTPMGMLLASPAHWEASEHRDADANRLVVDHVHVDATQIDGTGRVRGELRLPAMCPPSMPTFLTWTVSARAHRRHGFDRTGTATLQVLGPRPADLAATWQPAAPDSGNWLVRAGSSAEAWAQLPAPDRRREVELTLDRLAAAPGDTISGTITATVDPRRFYLERQHAKTRRGAEHIEAAAAAMPPTLRVDAVTVTLECWRGSELRQTCRRVAHRVTPVTGETTMTAGGSWTAPFTLTVPRAADVHMNTQEDKLVRPVPLPVTFPSDRCGYDQVDDLRWRVVATVLVDEGQFRDLPGCGGMSGPLGYSGSQPGSPLWTAVEVAITEPSPAS